MIEKENTFFTKDIYDSQIDLETNEEVLERIYVHVTADVCLPVEFFFVSDKEEKLKALGLFMMESFPAYAGFKIGTYEDIFELIGETSPLQMELQSINEWNKKCGIWVMRLTASWMAGRLKPGVPIVKTSQIPFK